MHAREMHDSPEENEKYPASNDRKPCKKYSSADSSAKTKEKTKL